MGAGIPLCFGSGVRRGERREDGVKLERWQVFGIG